MCNWEQAWLAYEPIENQRNRKFFKSVYTDQNGELVKSALQEIETASENYSAFRSSRQMTGRKQEFC